MNTLESSMKGKFNVLIGDSLEGGIIISRRDDNNILGDLEIVSKYKDSLLDGTIDISVRNNSNLSGSITIPPNNKMTAKVDIVPAPYRSVPLTIAKDTVMVSTAPVLNYGAYSEMLAGRDDNNSVYRSLIEFDLDKIPEVDLDKATLKLYNKRIGQSVELLIYEVDTEWSEKGISWIDKPTFSKLLKSFTAGDELGYVEVDFKDVLLDWYSNDKTVGGICIVAKDESINNVVTFATKESTNKPILEINYYEIPDSAGISRIDGTISVRVATNSKINGTIDINNNIVGSRLKGSIDIVDHHIDTSLDGSIDIKLQGSNSLPSSIELIREEGLSTLEGSMYVRANDSNVLAGNLDITNKDSYDNLDSEIVIRANTYNNLNGSFDIKNKHTKDTLDGVVALRGYDGDNLISSIDIEDKYDKYTLNGVMYIKGYDSKFLSSSLNITNKYPSDTLEGSISIKGYDNSYIDGVLTLDKKYPTNTLDGSIIVSNNGDDSLGGYLALISRKNWDILNSSIDIKAYDSTKLNGNIEIKNKNISTNLDGEITVLSYGSTSIDGNIDITKKYIFPSIDGEINIREPKSNTLDSNIQIRAYNTNDLIGTMTVIGGADLYGSLIIVSDYMDGSITLKGYDSKLLDSAMTVRVQWYNQIEGSIRVHNGKADIVGSIEVRKKNKGYVFMM